MSSFSPYIYNFNKSGIFTTLQIDVGDINSYYETFTILVKPEKRNVYKISLAQMLNYFVDFGIGYNSVCSHELKKDQVIYTAMYVNRHQSTSNKRPATVADFKKKLFGVVDAMIAHVVQPDTSGMHNSNRIYPTYFFTLDETLDSYKLKKITGKDYTEVTNFSDFAYSASTNYSMPKYPDGYVPADTMLLCPEHDHKDISKEMKKSIGYDWSSWLKPQGHTMWDGHAGNVNVKQFSKYNFDQWINPIYSGKIASTEECAVETSPRWEKPQSVSCFENEKVYPKNTLDVYGGKYVTIRYPGRRYRLFKMVGT